MKKVLSIIALLWGVAQFSSAEDFSYEFVKSDGSIVPNGSLVTITNAEVADDGSGDIVMNSGLGAFRRDGDVDDLLRIAYDIQTMDNGSMQICFPSACKYINSVSASATNPGKMTSQQQSIATEWFPTTYGKCTAKLSLQTVVSVIGGYEVLDEGRSSYAHLFRIDIRCYSCGILLPQRSASFLASSWNGPCPSVRWSCCQTLSEVIPAS